MPRVVTAGVPIRIPLVTIGDSFSNTTELSYESKVIEDMKAATSVLKDQCSLDRVVVLGICTGADNAHKHIVRDDRVDAAVFIDGYYYPTIKYYLSMLLPILFDIKRLVSFLVRYATRILKLFSGGAKISPGSDDAEFTWELPPKKQTEQELLNVLGRGARLMYIYTGMYTRFYKYSAQLYDAIPSLQPFKNQISILMERETDHTFSIPSDRDRIYSKILDWLRNLDEPNS